MANKQRTYEEKLSDLKRIHSLSSPEARQQIDKWQDEIARLNLTAEWLAHPDTLAMRKVLTDQLERIVSVLANDPTLTEAKRLAYFEAKGVIFNLLAIFEVDPVEEMKTIKNTIDFELE